MSTPYNERTNAQPFSIADELAPEPPSKTPLADAAFARADQRAQEGFQTWYTKWREEHHGAPGDDLYDYEQAYADKAIPKGGREQGLDFLPEQYYKSADRGRRRSTGFNYELNSRSYQLTDSFDRAIIKGVRDAAQGVISLTGRAAQVATLNVGNLASMVALSQAYEAVAGDAEKRNAFEKAAGWTDALDAVTFSPDNLPELPEIRLEDPETVQGMIEGMGADVVNLFASIGVGSAVLRGTTIDPVRAGNYVRRSLEFIKNQRGVALGELIYSQEGTGGNLSSLLSDMGIGGPITEFLDSTETDTKTEMAILNVLEGIVLGGFTDVAIQIGRGIPSVAATMRDNWGRISRPPPGSPGSQRGHITWHGSPFRFDRFNLDQIGKGEGAQAYGWGLYFAENRGIAGYYQKMLGSIPEADKIVDDWVDFVLDSGVTDKAELRRLMKESSRHRMDYWSSKAADDDEFLSAVLSGDAKGARGALNKGHLYEVEIPDEAIAKMLDWDKPLSEQPEVAAAIRQLGGDMTRKVLAEGERIGISPGGNSVYAALARDLGGQAEASKALASLGIPGIRYLDGTSRRAGEGSRNIVLFDDKLATIKSINGKPSSAGGGSGRPPDLPNEKPPGHVLVEIPIRDIMHGESALPGGKMREPGAIRVIQDYAMRDSEFPPIEVSLLEDMEDGASWMVSDGSLRLEAARVRGQDKIFAYVPKEEAARMGLREVELADEAAPGAAGQEAKTTDEHTLGFGDRKRELADTGPRLTASEYKSINEQIKQGNLTVRDRARAAKKALKYIARFPESQGWLRPTVAKVTRKKDRNGKWKYDVEYKKENYRFNRDAETGKPLTGAAREERKQQLRGRLVEGVRRVQERAAAGDLNAQVILRQAKWYSNMRARLRDEFGGMGDAFADFLGAASPNTTVDINWRFAVEALQKFSRGDYDKILADFVEHAENGGTIAQWKAAGNPMIRKDNGALFGMNSDNLMLAMAGLWRHLNPGTAPKARNFSGNLIGSSQMATIDVWAARHLNDLAGMPRLAPGSEKAVSGNWNADASKVTNDYGFATEVFDEGAGDLGMAADDLQAVAWFIEKEKWAQNKWTSKAGEGGSFEQEADKLPMSRTTAGLALGQAAERPSAEAVKAATDSLGATLGPDKAVVAYKAKPTIGRYMSDTGDLIEDAIDLEVTVTGDWDPMPLVREVARLAKESGQDSAFISRNITDPKQSENARPGAEIYFREATTVEDAQPIIDLLRERGVDGFTFSVDMRDIEGVPNVVGIRYQYVPEFDVMYGGLDPAKLEQRILDMEEKLTKVTEQISSMDNVSNSTVTWHDTLVLTKDDYDGLGAANDKSAGPNSGKGWPQLSVRANVERTNRAAKEPGVSGNDLPQRPDGGAQ